MDKAKRVLLNTLSQYIRTGLNIVLSLYSTRIVLEALGTNDYGLYSVIAGIVAMLSFVSNALVVSTQRYLSFSHGLNDNKVLTKVFSNSLFIHIIIGFALTLLLLSIESPVITSYLDIPLERINAAKIVYICVVLMISLSFITSPFRAIFIARENIVYISIIDVIDGILKVASAILLTYIDSDKLIAYAFLLVSISLFNLLAFGLYAYFRYEECHLTKFSDIDKSYIKKLTGFASWTLYSTGCVVIRTQGIAVILNKVFGVFLNAAYGIAQQVSGALLSIVLAIANSLSPQIIKAEGEKNRTKMLFLASVECKYSYLLLVMVAIPLIFKMPFILEIWLKSVPDNAVMFCNMVVIAGMCDTLTGGLGIANQAIGKIKVYSLVFGTLKIITLPIAYIAVLIDKNPFYIMLAFVLLELFSAIMRIFFIKSTAGLNVISFVKKIILPSLYGTLAVIGVCFAVDYLVTWKYNILLLVPASIVTVVTVAYSTMGSEEKNIVKRIYNRRTC